MKKMSSILASILVGCVQTGFAQGAAQQLTQIGAAAAVAGRVTALAPKAGSVGRVLSSGKTVFFKDRIATDARGRLQVLLLDETVFTLGPDTEMEIDEFVYDPFTESGTVSTRVNKGTFRFVSGKVARKRPSNMKVKLPTGTLGIRGTIAGGTIFSDGSILIALLGPGADNNADERPGSIEVTNAGQSVTLSRPGFATIIRPGQPPTPPFRLSPEQLAQLNTKPQAESGAGDPEGTQEEAKNTGELGEAKTVAQATGSEQAEGDETEQATLNGAQMLSLDNPDIVNWEVFGTGLSGTGFFTASANYDCSGGINCSGNPTNQSFATIHFDVNWAARTLGGTGTSSHFAFGGGALCPPTCGPELDSQIPTINFSSLSGDAKLTQGTDFTGTNADFNGSSFQFNSPNGAAFSGTIIFNGTTANSGLNNNGATATVTMTGSCISGTCP